MLFKVVIIVACYVLPIDGHGRMIEPPARNALWRFDPKAPANYNDNELFCGGISVITQNQGKCGVCGDPYQGPRIHETGNYMATNQTTRNYFPGSSIDVLLEIEANHGGRFYFQMCWRDSWDTLETEDCFDNLKLNGQDIEEDGDAYVLDPASGSRVVALSVELPTGKECSSCVFRWHWLTANNWGVCEDGVGAVGCGYQEIYRNCADVSISRRGGPGLRIMPGRSKDL